MTEDKALEKLFPLLNRRALTLDIKKQFYPFGKDAFDFLESRIDSPNTTELQVVNSLVVMFDLRRATDQSKFFMRLLRMSHDSRKRVRSQAIGMAVGWTRGAEHMPKAFGIPEAQRDLVLPWARDSLALGLDGNATSLVQAFISGEI